MPHHGRESRLSGKPNKKGSQRKAPQCRCQRDGRKFYYRGDFLEGGHANVGSHRKAVVETHGMSVVGGVDNQNARKAKQYRNQHVVEGSWCSFLSHAMPLLDILVVLDSGETRKDSQKDHRQDVSDGQFGLFRPLPGACQVWSRVLFRNVHDIHQSIVITIPSHNSQRAPHRHHNQIHPDERGAPQPSGIPVQKLDSGMRHKLRPNQSHTQRQCQKPEVAGIDGIGYYRSLKRICGTNNVLASDKGSDGCRCQMRLAQGRGAHQRDDGHDGHLNIDRCSHIVKRIGREGSHGNRYALGPFGLVRSQISQKGIDTSSCRDNDIIAVFGMRRKNGILVIALAALTLLVPMVEES
mmetsp:Transcript_20756/g.51488  ORF Transcript_20756/g.51488 Transcript_20756/m.51488 type:complete len:352 (-) Transcript_20756:157-1212(-)